MAIDVDLTYLADRQRKGLRSKHATQFDRWLDQLKHDGCRALGYRLTGDRIEHLCVRHLSGTLRVIVAFHSPDHAIVLLVGPHDDSDPGIDVYARLYALAGIDVPPADKRTKPPCCDEKGQPPMGGAVADDLVNRARHVARQRRRQQPTRS